MTRNETMSTESANVEKQPRVLPVVLDEVLERAGEIADTTRCLVEATGAADEPVRESIGACTMSLDTQIAELHNLLCGSLTGLRAIQSWMHCGAHDPAS